MKIVYFLASFFNFNLQLNILFLSIWLNFCKLLEISFSLLLSNKIPLFPPSKNSFGPFGQLLEITNRLEIAASTITKPTSSHKDDKIKISPFLKYLPLNKTLIKVGYLREKPQDT